MAIVNGYCSLADIKRYMNIDTLLTDYDADLERAVESASREVENRTGRFFYATSGAIRYYTPEYPRMLIVDDFTAITQVASDIDLDGTYSEVWASTDFYATPMGFASGKPATAVHLSSLTTKAFPKMPNYIRVTGTAGYCAIADVPEPIVEATILLAARTYQRRNAIYGRTGYTPFGTETTMPIKDDPDIHSKLAQYIRVM